MIAETTAAEPARKRVRPALVEHLVTLATDAFARHEIRSRTETSIVIQRRNDDGSWSNHYATEIVAGALSHLIVTGDIDTVVFARQSGSLRARLGWIAPKEERGASWRYLVEKASIGMTCNRKLATEFAPELAEDLIADLVQDAWEHDRHLDHEQTSRAEQLREISLPSDESDINEFINELEYAGISDAWEYIGSLYEVSPRVVYAWAACRKAGELIDVADAQAVAAAAQADATPILSTNPDAALGGDHG